MKKLSYTRMLLGCLLAAVALNACQDRFLELKPQGALSEATLASKAGVDRLLIGAYSLLDNGGTPGGGWPSGKWIFGGVASDDAHTGTEAAVLQPVPLYENYTHNATTTSANSKWRVLYAGVQRSNDVLRVLAQVKQAKGISNQDALQLEAEARFLRALYHLEAALMWRNIPYIDETVSFASDNYHVPNTSPAWPRIEADFTFAADNLTETKVAAGRANSWAAKAFLVKTYMFQQKFAEAKPLLADIIANGVTAKGLKYALLERYADNFKPSKKNNAESVFAVQMSVNDGAGGNNGNASNGTGHAGPYGGPYPSYGFYQPSFNLVNAYKTDPVSGLPLIDTYDEQIMDHDLGIPSSSPFTPYQGTLDARLDWTVSRRGIPLLDWGLNPGQAWVRQQSVAGPYLNVKNTNPRSEPQAREFNSSAVNDVLIRFADVLLWAAEVAVETGSLEQAEAYVNQVRARAANPEGWVKTYIDPQDPAKGFTATPAANYKVGLYSGQFATKGKDFAREAVRFERRLELAMEGHRFFDLQRYDKGSGYMAEVLNAYIAYETGIPNYNFVYMKGATFQKGKNELYPIPQEQIDLHTVNGASVLKQNPGY